MANKTLIQGAGRAGNQFVDVGRAFMAGVMVPMTEQQRINQAQARYNARMDEIELKNYVNSMEDIDVAKIEESMRPEVNDFLISNKNEYANAARIASEADADSQAYQEAVSTMNRINSAFKSLSASLDTFKKNRDQFYLDVKNNVISKASDLTDLNNLYKNEDYEIAIDQYGGVTLVHNGEMVPLASFDDDTSYNYHLKNVKGFEDIMKLTNEVHNQAVELKGGARDIVSRNLSILFNNMGREDLLSMAFDNMLDSSIPIIEREDFDDTLLNVENEDALRKYLHDTYLNGLEAVATSAYKQKTSGRNTGGGGRGGGSRGGGGSSLSRFYNLNADQIAALGPKSSGGIGTLTAAEVATLLKRLQQEKNTEFEDDETSVTAAQIRSILKTANIDVGNISDEELLKKYKEGAFN